MEMSVSSLLSLSKSWLTTISNTNRLRFVDHHPGQCGSLVLWQRQQSGKRICPKRVLEFGSQASFTSLLVQNPSIDGHQGKQGQCRNKRQLLSS